MKQTYATQADLKPSNPASPFARRQEAVRFPFSAHRENQGGRCARTWLPRSAGLLCVAIGWALAFAGIAVAPAGCIPVELGASVGSLVGSVAFMAFGVGWICCDGRSEK